MSVEITVLPIAALITSTVAVSLFILKEILEFFRKKGEKEGKINAIMDIAAREVFNLTREIELFFKLKGMLNYSRDIEFVDSHGGNLMQFGFNYESSSRYISIPKCSTIFSHLFLVESAKVSHELANKLHNLNTAIFDISQIIDACIECAKNKDIESFNDTIDFVLAVKLDDDNGIILPFLEIIDQFSRDAEKFNGFKEAYSIINFHFRGKPSGI